MVTDRQVRMLVKQLQGGRTLAGAAARADMDEKTARKYRRGGRLPSESRAAHTWQTRPDPFAEVWERVRQQLSDHPELEAKTLFEALQREAPGRFMGLTRLRGHLPRGGNEILPIMVADCADARCHHFAVARSKRSVRYAVWWTTCLLDLRAERSALSCCRVL